MSLPGAEVPWNRCDAIKFRTDEQVQFYFESMRPFAMRRNKTDMSGWRDYEEHLAEWQDTLAKDCANPSGKLLYLSLITFI